MLSNDTKNRLGHAVTDFAIGDQIAARLVESAPANASEAEDLLRAIDESKNKDIKERLFSALAGDGSQGHALADRLEKMVDVLKAVADGDEVAGTPAEAASFTGQVAGMTTNVTIDADVAGEDGNLVLLSFDGSDDIDTVIAAWNLANPGNEVTLSSGDGSQIPDNGEEITLSGGADAVLDSDANLAPALAALGSEPMSAEMKTHLVSALADQKAADEFEAAFNQAIDELSSL